jgi:3-deoxy-D-manno-octulosonic acid (KDO) 8-phosphate synthase
MNDIKLRNFTIGNSQPLSLMGGMNVLESRDLVLKVAEKFKSVSEKLLLTRLIEAQYHLLGGPVLMRVLNYFKKYQQNLMFL